MQLDTSVTTAPTRGVIARYAHTTFSSLRLRNYRLYFVGQGISLVGTWMQGVAQTYLVWRLTGSGVAVGFLFSAQFLPVLFFAPYGGLLADRFSKRRMLLATQSCAAFLAAILGILVFTGAVRLWMVFGLAFGLGIVNALDNPTRQTFVHELVGDEDLRNAVTLNSLEVNLTRILGPLLAGGVIALVGIPLCFGINAVSFIGVIVCLALMRSSELHKSAPVKAAKGQLREGFDYVRRTPVIRDALIMMALVGTLTYEFPVTLSMLAYVTFHGTIVTYTLLTAALGVGAVLGGLATAGRKRAAVRGLTLASFGFGVTMVLVAASPSLIVALLAMFAVGAFSVAFTALTNTILQLESDPEMRGRVMSLWSVAFLGSTPIGAPIVGWIGQRFDPRVSIAVGGLAALAAGVVGLWAMRKHSHAASEDAVVQQPAVAEKEDFA